MKFTVFGHVMPYSLVDRYTNVRVELIALFFRIYLSYTLETSLYTEREKVLEVHVLEFQIHARD